MSCLAREPICEVPFCRHLLADAFVSSITCMGITWVVSTFTKSPQTMSGMNYSVEAVSIPTLVTRQNNCYSHNGGM